MRVYMASTVVQLLGIPYHQLTYWEITKKIPPARRTENHRRFYTEEDIVELRRAIQMARLGEKRLSLEHRR